MLAAGLSWGQDSDPVHRVESFHHALLGVMRSGADFDTRFQALGPAVEGLFDIPTIARVSLGRTWRSLDAESQAEFTELLRRLILATYANRFHSFNNQSFHTIAAEQVGRGWVVKTELRRTNGERVALDYYFREAGVFNVVADGVSDLSLRRADYNSILKTDGFGSLLAHLRERIVELSDQGE